MGAWGSLFVQPDHTRSHSSAPLIVAVHTISVLELCPPTRTPCVGLLQVNLTTVSCFQLLATRVVAQLAGVLCQT